MRRAARPGAAAGPELKNIKRAEGGQTVEEIVTGKAKFAGKAIAVRGRVVKSVHSDHRLVICDYLMK